LFFLPRTSYGRVRLPMVEFLLLAVMTYKKIKE
jgi:hypothetical protein